MITLLGLGFLIAVAYTARQVTHVDRWSGAAVPAFGAGSILLAFLLAGWLATLLAAVGGALLGMATGRDGAARAGFAIGGWLAVLAGVACLILFG